MIITKEQIMVFVTDFFKKYKNITISIIRLEVEIGKELCPLPPLDPCGVNDIPHQMVDTFTVINVIWCLIDEGILKFTPGRYVRAVNR